MVQTNFGNFVKYAGTPRATPIFRFKILAGIQTPSGDRLLFNKEVDALLQNLPKENLIIAGYFNINLFSSLASEFEDIMFSNNLIQTVSQATHERPGCKPSLIDNILINSTENHILSGVLQSRVSHHFPIFKVFTCPVLNAQANSDKTYQVMISVNLILKILKMILQKSFLKHP